MTGFTYVILCRGCGGELNRAVGVPEHEKGRVVVTAPLMAGRCINGCPSTWSDCNLKWSGTWYPDADAPAEAVPPSQKVEST